MDTNEESFEVTWPTKPGEKTARKKAELNFQIPALLLKNVLIDDPEIDDELILIGIEGEERVFNSIEKILGNSIAFHSIPLKRFKKDIDHLIVVGDEVILLNTKNYRLENMLVDGEYIIYGRKRLTDLIDLQRDAREIEKITGIKVKPMLVLSTNIKVKVINTPILPIITLDSLIQIIESGANLTPSSNYVAIINNRKTWGLSAMKQFTSVHKSKRGMFSKRKPLSKKVKNKLIRKAVFWGVSIMFMIPSINSMLSLSNSLSGNSNLADIYSQPSINPLSELEQCYSEADGIPMLNLCNSFHGATTSIDLPAKRANCQRLEGEVIEKGVVHKWECNQTPENCIKNSQSIFNLNSCNISSEISKDDPIRNDKIVQEKVYKCETLGGVLVYSECKILPLSKS